MGNPARWRKPATLRPPRPAPMTAIVFLALIDDSQRALTQVAFSKARRGVDPQHASELFSIVDIGVRPFGAEIKAVARAQLIAAIIHRQFDLAIEHVAQLFAFMLEDPFASSAGLAIVDVTGQQVAAATRNHRLDPPFLPSTSLIRPPHHSSAL